jgi:hypothetical protein
MRALWILLLFPLVFALASCGNSQTDAGNASNLPSANPQDSPSRLPLTTQLPALPIQGDNTQMPPSLSTLSASGIQGLIDLAKEDLARRLSISVTQISFIEATEAIWPDSSLGCSQTGMGSAQVMTPGYLILLGYNNKNYEYHTNKGTYVTYCMNPTQPDPGIPDH